MQHILLRSRSIFGTMRSSAGSMRSFAKETKRAYDPPPDAPSKNAKYALFIGVTGLAGLAYLFSLEKNDYGISWYADQTLDESKMPVPRPSSSPGLGSGTSSSK